ncbi:MAG: hypothetical protein GYA21_01635 [Myxococcales bacterium]|nr:hypothetical protein [Myxococcales bacterium]
MSGRRIAPWLAPALAVLLYLPSLWSGFYIDDFYHQALMDGAASVPPQPWWRLYTFAEGDTDRLSGIQGDVVPWWAAESFRLDFLRPLGCVSLWLDRAIYGRSPAGYHLTNILLYAALVFLLWRLFLRFSFERGSARAIALLGAVFFAVDEAHVLNVHWIASRHALLAGLFSALSVGAYFDWRRSGAFRDRARALGLLALGLLSSETALAAVAWIVAIEIFREEHPARRISAVAPVLLLSGAYLALYAALGAGAGGSDWYRQPFAQPLEFAREALLSRLLLLAMGAFTTVPPEISLLPSARGALWPVLLALSLVGIVLLLLGAHLARSRTSRGLLAGSLFAMLATTSAWPMNRLLIVATMPSALLFAGAVFDGMAAGREAGRLRRLCLRTGAVVFVLVHLVVSLVQTVIHRGQYAAGGDWMEETVARSAFPGEPEATEARVLLLNGPEHGMYLPAYLHSLGIPAPAGAWAVTVSREELLFSRTGLGSFRMEAKTGSFLGSAFERLVTDEAPREGRTARRGELSVTLARVVDEKVLALDVSLTLPLDDNRVWLLAFDGCRWRRLIPPVVGGEMTLPAPAKTYCTTALAGTGGDRPPVTN